MTKKEIQLLIALVESQKSTIGFLRGFGISTQDEQNKKDYYNQLIEKLNNLIYNQLKN